MGREASHIPEPFFIWSVPSLPSDFQSCSLTFSMILFSLPNMEAETQTNQHLFFHSLSDSWAIDFHTPGWQEVTNTIHWRDFRSDRNLCSYLTINYGPILPNWLQMRTKWDLMFSEVSQFQGKEGAKLSVFVLAENIIFKLLSYLWCQIIQFAVIPVQVRASLWWKRR